MTVLSVNLNRIALLRNARNIGIPSVEVSIGHALVSDALTMGLGNAVYYLPNSVLSISRGLK